MCFFSEWTLNSLRVTVADPGERIVPHRVSKMPERSIEFVFTVHVFTACSLLCYLHLWHRPNVGFLYMRILSPKNVTAWHGVFSTQVCAKLLFMVCSWGLSTSLAWSSFSTWSQLVPKWTTRHVERHAPPWMVRYVESHGYIKAQNRN